MLCRVMLIKYVYAQNVAFIVLKVNEVSGSPADLLSRRCVGQMKKALSPEVWPNCELKLGWFDKILMSVEGQQPNFGTICTALELLTFLLSILVSVFASVVFAVLELAEDVLDSVKYLLRRTFEFV